MIKDGHTDVSSSRRMCRSILEDVGDILRGLPKEETSLPTWWTNKLAVSTAYLNSARDYLLHSTGTPDIEELKSVDDHSFTVIIEKDEESVPEEVTVNSYTTENFDICPTAAKLYENISFRLDDDQMQYAERSAKLHDALFYIEKHAIEMGEASDSTVLAAQNIADEIMILADMMNLQGMHDYVESVHVAKIEELANKQEMKVEIEE